jgi:hypothetical protein
MVLALVISAWGYARFSVSLGWDDAKYRYVPGILFELGKEIVLVPALAFWRRRRFSFALVFGSAWVCLVLSSVLATEATIVTGINSREQTGTWKMDVRNNRESELGRIEQQLAAMSRRMPRPAKIVREELVTNNVPPAIWKDGNECNGIQKSTYLAKACGQVVQLRRELVAAQEYERLSARAGELSKGLADAPIVDTSDPLPAAFTETIGRVLPVSGKEGVAMLLTAAIELISAFGLAGLSSLASTRLAWAPDAVSPQTASSDGRSLSLGAQSLTHPPVPTGSNSHNSTTSKPPEVTVVGAIAAHMVAFSQERLQPVAGGSLWHKDLRAKYEAWCASNGHVPLSLPKFAAALKALGYAKRKSCGRSRYLDVQLVPIADGSMDREDKKASNTPSSLPPTSGESPTPTSCGQREYPGWFAVNVTHVPAFILDFKMPSADRRRQRTTSAARGHMRRRGRARRARHREAE